MKYIYNIGRGELEDTTAPVTTQLDLFENKPTTTVSSPGPVNRVSTGQGGKPIVKQKYKYELQKEVENLKKQNRVLAKHQTPIPEDVEDVKYESVPGVFMGQSSNKKYTPKDATAMNQQWDRVSPEDKNTLRLIQKTNYEYGTNNEQKPLWLEKAEKNKKNTSREARTEQKRGGSSTGVTAKIQKKPIGYVKTIAPNKKFDLWNDGIKTDKSPQNIARVRKIVNDSVKSFGHTKFLTPDEFKYIDKKKDAPPVPSSPILDTSLELLEPRPTAHETPIESFDQFYARREHERKEREFNENIKTGIGPLFKIHKRKFND